MDHLECKLEQLERLAQNTVVGHLDVARTVRKTRTEYNCGTLRCS